MVAVDGLIWVVVVVLSRKYQIMAETVVDSNMDVKNNSLIVFKL